MKNLTFLLPLLFVSCMFWDVPPVIPDPPVEIVVDTCETYIEVTQPEFITGVLHFDVIPDSLIWMTGNNNPVQLSQFFADYDLYVSGINVCLIVRHTNNSVLWNSYLFARDGTGLKHYLSFSKQSLSLGGAVTFDQHRDIIQEFPSGNIFSLWNTYYDSIQCDILYADILGDCRKGRKRADLRYKPISQDRIDQFVAAQWQQVWY